MRLPHFKINLKFREPHTENINIFVKAKFPIMNIHQLEYLIAVDKFKHFGKAAQACSITQPTLSAMIQKLEEELDIKIFDRTSHPIRTTDSGQQIIIQAQQIVDAVNDLRNTANYLKNIIGGKITLGIIPTVSPYLLPYQIFGFLKDNPKVEMNVKEMQTDSIIKALKTGEIDAGIIATPYDAADEFSGNFLFNEELMLYSSESNKDKYVVPEDIDVEKVWLLEEGNCLRTQFENICQLKENSLAPKNLNFVASNISTLLQMVDQVGGITILPELATKHLSENRTKGVARFRKPFPYREISIIYYKPTYKQRIIDELVSYIKKSFEGQLNYQKNPDDYVSIRPQ